MKRNLFLIFLTFTVNIILFSSFDIHNIVKADTCSMSYDRNINLISGTKTEKCLDKELKKRHFIGTVTLIKNNHLVYQEGYGYANKLKGIRNSGNTTFQIASIQKGITAAMLMKVASQKHFSLNTPLSYFYPNIKNANCIDLRNLLTMTSGIISQKLPKYPMNDEKFLQYTIKHTKIYKPLIGKMKYQPVNFVLIVGIIQSETKMSYYNYFNRVIKKPLNLNHSYFYQNMNHYENTQAQGYHFNKSNPYKVFYERLFGYTGQLGTGNMYMSNGDLYRTIRAFLDSKILTKFQTTNLYSSGGLDSPYVSGMYRLSDNLVPGLLSNQYQGYHFHGAEFGFETVGDITKNGATAVIFSSNSANYNALNNYRLDIPVYRSLINDSEIF